MADDQEPLGSVPKAVGTLVPQNMDLLTDEEQIDHLFKVIERQKQADSKVHPDDRQYGRYIYVMSQVANQRSRKAMEVTSGGHRRKGKPGIVPGWDEVIFPARGIIYTPGNNNISPDTSIVLGGTLSNPIKIGMPFWGSPESIGSSTSAFHANKIIAASQVTIDDIVGLPCPTGEGGEHADLVEICKRLEKEFRPIITKQYASARFGISLQYINGSYIIEIKMGQGAKPAEGGELPAHKNWGLVPRLRYVKPFQKAKSPATQFYNVEPLRSLVRKLRLETRGKAVIGIKLATVDVYQDVTTAAVALEGDGYIVIDGAEASTGAAKTFKRQEVGIPSILSIADAREALEDLGDLRGNIKLGVSGGYGYGDYDAFKAIFAGGDFVNYGFAEMIASGCYECAGCHKPNCGITNQAPKPSEIYASNKSFNVKNLKAFWEAQGGIWKEVLRAYGMTDTGYYTDHIAGVRNPQPSHLVALTEGASRALGIPYLSTRGPNLRAQMKREERMRLLEESLN